MQARRSGPTLLELIVVIAVQATLVAMGAPNVFRHVDAARGVAERAKIEMLGAALDASGRAVLTAYTY